MEGARHEINSRIEISGDRICLRTCAGDCFGLLVGCIFGQRQRVSEQRVSERFKRSRFGCSIERGGLVCGFGSHVAFG